MDRITKSEKSYRNEVRQIGLVFRIAKEIILIRNSLSSTIERYKDNKMEEKGLKFFENIIKSLCCIRDSIEELSRQIRINKPTAIYDRFRFNLCSIQPDYPDIEYKFEWWTKSGNIENSPIARFYFNQEISRLYDDVRIYSSYPDTDICRAWRRYVAEILFSIWKYVSDLDDKIDAPLFKEFKF